MAESKYKLWNLTLKYWKKIVIGIILIIVFSGVFFAGYKINIGGFSCTKTKTDLPRFKTNNQELPAQ